MEFILGIIVGILLAIIATLTNTEKRQTVLKEIKNKISPQTGGIIETRTDEDIINKILE